MIITINNKIKKKEKQLFKVLIPYRMPHLNYSSVNAFIICVACRDEKDTKQRATFDKVKK